MSSLRGLPLTVRLVGNGVDMHITPEVRDLSLRSTAVGGYASATFALDRPIRQDAPELAVMNKMYVYDGRSGEIVWQGNTEDPARSAGSDGLLWSVNAIGPAGRAQDQIGMPVYADTRIGGWRRTLSNLAVHLTVSEDENPARLLALAPRGVTYNLGDEARWLYEAIAEAGMEVARLQVVWDNGVTDTNMRMRLRGFPSSLPLWADIASNTAGGTATVTLGSGINSGDTTAALSVTRVNTNITPANDVTWGSFESIVIRGKLVDKTGTAITTGYTANTVLASEVVADVLGRMCPAFDGALASIATTSYGIDQLQYTGGATAAEILDDLMLLEPAYKWAVWGDTVNNKPGFIWDAWPATARYEADVSAGFSSPQSSAELYDSVMVKWTDAAGVPRKTIVTGSVPQLQGVPRRGLVDLGSGIGSAANATRAGQQFLTEHATATNAGTLIVADRIVDLIAGRMVYPWQIRPGNLIRVNGVNARPDALNAANSNGVTTFRIAAVEFSAASTAATLELDSYSPSLARAIADVRSRIATLRRG